MPETDSMSDEKQLESEAASFISRVLTEKMDVDLSAVVLLKDAIERPELSVQRLLESPKRASPHNQKLDLPLLRTDHELDVHRILRREEPDLRRMPLPFIPIDSDNAEGFDWT